MYEYVKNILEYSNVNVFRFESEVYCSLDVVDLVLPHVKHQERCLRENE